MSSSATRSSRPGLLLLCGLLCDASIWQPQRAALSDLAEVQVLDFAGFDSIVQMAAHVLAVAPPQFAVAGHSMGGRVALEIMRQAPQRVQRLALLDTGIAPRRDGERDQRAALMRLAHTQGMQALARQWLPPMLHPDRHADAELMNPLIAMVQRHSVQDYAGQIEALLERPDAAPVLAQIRCPTLLGVGRQDLWSPLAQHQQMAQQIPHARLVVFENSGHMAPLEAPAAVSAAMRDWLQDA
ncbi:alpha/beta fold hydrolase [Xanthomonas arboricola]|uniref:3-oxoadipate enol-lactonase 2 n=1 Tax=Xanthomonas arboricola TaxID=56448 RepID=A0AAU9HN28_9XANT|nr:alpha/beta hydrolase [Xanthomonas arboricola]NJB78070.1 pimeloyl-ACP methyl ester carboxylesterase [Xanthomonas arboricola]CAE6720820.1 3-oxoadipate enol-lactonase 2 [Xanthomonas arboricola]CAE6720837.1 3-oxoadipate enol-lactonase 2 [Xanthomonas arboricola]